MQINWNNINVAQFCELKSFKFEDFDSETDFISNIISLVLDRPIEEIYELPMNELKELRRQIDFVFTPPKSKHKEAILLECNETLFLIPNLNFLTVGEFIDLEHFFTTSYFDNFRLILAILYRRKIKKQTLFDTEEFEKYGNYIFIRQNLFDELFIQDVYGCINYYLKWREGLYSSYEGLFNNSTDEEITEAELQEADVETRNELKKELIKQKTVQKWAWNLFLYRICEVYNCSEEEAAGKNILSVLNRLATKVELNLK